VLRYQLILQSEAAYQCVAKLGEIEAVQFLDSNPEMSAFQRKYVAEIKRCDELERILRYIKREAIKEGIIPVDPGLYFFIHNIYIFNFLNISN
jgi:V-type H+-transporting ATPase subunit a